MQTPDTELHATEIPKIAVALGSEADTLDAILRFLEKNPDAMRLFGIVATTRDLVTALPGMMNRVPGALLDRVSLLEQDGRNQEGSLHPVRLRYVVPESAKWLQKKVNRSAFSENVRKAVLETTNENPNAVFLLSMMYFLSESYSNMEIPGREVTLGTVTWNSHPSILPYIRGGRAELKNLTYPTKGNLPWMQEAMGFTVHSIKNLMTSGDVPMDCGTVAWQLQVEQVRPFDAELESKYGRFYVQRIEEEQRQAGIRALIPWIGALASHLTALPRNRLKIVADHEAFAVEGRDPDEVLQKEYQLWLFENEKSGDEVPFDQWFEHERPPYQRFLVPYRDKGPGSQHHITLEKKIGSPRVAEAEGHPGSEYFFGIALEGKSPDEIMSEAERLPQILTAEAEQHGRLLSSFFRMQNGVLYGQVFTTRSDFDQVLRSFGCSDYHVDVRRVRVGSKRSEAEGGNIKEHVLKLQAQEAERVDNESAQGRS